MIAKLWDSLVTRRRKDSFLFIPDDCHVSGFKVHSADIELKLTEVHLPFSDGTKPDSGIWGFKPCNHCLVFFVPLYDIIVEKIEEVPSVVTPRYGLGELKDLSPGWWKICPKGTIAKVDEPNDPGPLKCTFGIEGPRYVMYPQP